MAKHTNGPWKTNEVIGASDDGRSEWSVFGADGEYIASVEPAPIGEQLSDEEIAANARLIAAAPDMLDALTALTACDERGRFGAPNFHAAIKQARAAIALATSDADAPTREG